MDGPVVELTRDDAADLVMVDHTAHDANEEEEEEEEEFVRDQILFSMWPRRGETHALKKKLDELKDKKASKIDDFKKWLKMKAQFDSLKKELDFLPIKKNLRAAQETMDKSMTEIVLKVRQQPCAQMNLNWDKMEELEETFKSQDEKISVLLKEIEDMYKMRQKTENDAEDVMKAILDENLECMDLDGMEKNSARISIWMDKRHDVVRNQLIDQEGRFSAIKKEGFVNIARQKIFVKETAMNNFRSLDANLKQTLESGEHETKVREIRDVVLAEEEKMVSVKTKIKEKFSESYKELFKGLVKKHQEELIILKEAEEIFRSSPEIAICLTDGKFILKEEKEKIMPQAQTVLVNGFMLKAQPGTNGHPGLADLTVFSRNNISGNLAQMDSSQMVFIIF